MSTPALRSESRSIGELFGELTQDLSLLFRQEVQLAKAELSEKARRAGEDGARLAMGGGVALVGALALVAALILILAEFMPAWLSALLVGAVFAIAGYILVKRGLDDLKRIDPVPRRTAETIRTDVHWAKEQVR